MDRNSRSKQAKGSTSRRGARPKDMKKSKSTASKTGGSTPRSKESHLSASTPHTNSSRESGSRVNSASFKPKIYNSATALNSSANKDHLSPHRDSLSRNYLSKSHENLASGLRRRANSSGIRQPRPVSWISGQSNQGEFPSYIPVKTPTANSSQLHSTPTHNSTSTLNNTTNNTADHVAGHTTGHFKPNHNPRQVNFADIEPRSTKTQTVKSIPLKQNSLIPSDSSSPLRKATSVQNLKSASQAIKRASSIDNLCRPTASSLQKKSHISKNDIIREEKAPSRSPSRLPVNISRRIEQNRIDQSHTSTHKMAANGNSGSPPLTMKKSSSIQNISRSHLSVLRRAQSSQNVSVGGRDPRSSVRNRASTPSTALAYNAELLAIFEKEKKIMEGRISELIQITESRKGEIEKHKIEIKNLTELIPKKSLKDEVERLKSENKLYKSKLLEMGVTIEVNGAPIVTVDLSEDETDYPCNISVKTPLYQASSRKSGGSSGCLLDDFSSLDLCDQSGTDFNSGVDSGWDKGNHTSRTVNVIAAAGESSVASLQEQINRMEESQYCTNEELQATLQELGDLQRNVNQLAEENEKLGAERMVLLESLCTQTDKLGNARTQIEHLKALILTDTDHTQTEREQELVNLLKIATEEREEFMLKQCEIHNALESFDLDYKDMQERVISLNEKCKQLEDKRQNLSDEKRDLESQLHETTEELEKERIELDRYKQLLENEKGKVLELEKLHEAEDKSELERLVENTRADKEKLEQKCANLTETLAHIKREVGKVKSDNEDLVQEIQEHKQKADHLQQELLRSRNNNKSHLDDLEFKYDKVTADHGQLAGELRELKLDLERQRRENSKLTEENKNNKIAVSDLQAELKGAKHRYVEFEKEMEMLSARHEEEASDWKQFQADLQTAVVIANAIKAEAVEEKELLMERHKEVQHKMDELQKQLHSTQTELERLKSQKSSSLGGILPAGELKKHLLGSDRDLTALKQGRRLSDMRGNQSNLVSVKSLIRSIEGQGSRQGSLGSSTESSRRGSSDSLVSPTTGLSMSHTSLEGQARVSPERRSGTSESLPLRSAIKKPKEDADKSVRPYHAGSTRLYEKSSSPVIDSLRPELSRTRSDSDQNFDPLAKLVKQTGGSKRNALLKWCQLKTKGYREVEVTNFSSSWNDGLAFCALLHSYIPEQVNFEELASSHDKRNNFTTAFRAAESVGIPSTLNVNEMVSIERPDWQLVMAYVTSIYHQFEAD